MAENYYYSTLSGDEIENRLIGGVLFNTDQALTTSQKAVARANIGAGEANSTFKILGYFDTLEDLQEWLQVLPQSGDAYGIGAESPYDVYVYDGIHNTWVNNGPIAYSDALIDDNDISLERTWSSTKISTEVGSVRTLANAAQATADAAQATAGGKAPISHASPATTYGVGNGTNYGHLKLADSPNASQGTGSGVAATPAAVQAAIDAGKWQLLWTNPSPSADFAAQTVPLDLSAYSEFVITYRQWKADTEISNQQYFFGYAVKTITIMTPVTSNGQVYLAARKVTISSTGITFGAAASKTSLNGNATTDNGWIVPYQIYAR